MTTSDRKHFLISRWDLLPAAGFSVLTAFYLKVLPLLPECVPTHFNKAGIADGWTPKSELYWIILGIPCVVWLMFLAVGAVATFFYSDPQKARAASLHPARAFITLGISIVMGAGLVIPLFGLQALHGSVALFFLCVALGIVFTVRETESLLAGEPGASHYRWGLFYVNREDPRLWVEKRLGVGKTLNYAHPSAWLISLLFFLALAAAIFFLR